MPSGFDLKLKDGVIAHVLITVMLDGESQSANAEPRLERCEHLAIWLAGGFATTAAELVGGKLIAGHPALE